MMSFMTRTAIRRALAAIAVCLAISLTAAPAEAQQRYVVVNGVLMTAQDLYVLDRLAGYYVPNGNYWLDPNTGIWGYAGNPYPQGQIGGGAGGGGGSNYSGDLDRGPFGTYMSDGNCSFVNGVPVGDC